MLRGGYDTRGREISRAVLVSNAVVKPCLQPQASLTANEVLPALVKARYLSAWFWASACLYVNTDDYRLAFNIDVPMQNGICVSASAHRSRIVSTRIPKYSTKAST
jgi:hypothetical protein